MLSRVANSIYWMSRYLERADNVARFIDVNSHLMLDMGWQHEDAQWDPIVMVTGDEADFTSRYEVYDENNVAQFLTFDTDNPNSIISCIDKARENARTVREIITTEMWEAINGLYHLVHDHAGKNKSGALHDFLESIHSANHLFVGHMYNTMSNGEGWHFARAGRLIERADKTARLLDMKYFLLLPHDEHVGSAYDSVEWGAVLKSVSGFEMYQKQYHRANYRDVTRFLILDPDFPRAIRYCIGMTAISLDYIADGSGARTAANDAMAEIQNWLDSTGIKTILEAGLHDFIDDLQFRLNAADEAIHRSFFGY